MNMEIKIQEQPVINKEKKVVGAQISADLYEQLKTLAAENFMSVSDYIRMIITLYLRDRNK